MAPHLTKSELDTITKLAAEGKTVAEIHCGIGAKRAKRGMGHLGVSWFLAALLQNGVNEGVWHRVGVGFAEVVFTSIETSLNNS